MARLSFEKCKTILKWYFLKFENVLKFQGKIVFATGPPERLKMSLDILAKVHVIRNQKSEATGRLK